MRRFFKIHYLSFFFKQSTGIKKWKVINNISTWSIYSVWFFVIGPSMYIPTDFHWIFQSQGHLHFEMLEWREKIPKLLTWETGLYHWMSIGKESLEYINKTKQRIQTQKITKSDRINQFDMAGILRAGTSNDRSVPWALLVGIPSVQTYLTSPKPGKWLYRSRSSLLAAGPGNQSLPSLPFPPPTPSLTVLWEVEFFLWPHPTL